LETLRKETEKYGIILIFDEVMTGFRVSFGGAQAYYASSLISHVLARLSAEGCRSARTAVRKRSCP